VNDPTAVFLFGFERSGTTLLSMMVGGHPQIAVPLSATGLWYRYGKALAQYNDLRSCADLERLVDDLLQEERVRLWDTHFTRDEVLDGLEPGSYAAVVARFHGLYARHKGKPRWGNIDIGTLDDMDAAYRWFPDAVFVHIVRDGRDVALSHQTYVYGTANIWECAGRWAAKVHTNLKMGAMLGPARYVVLRYEDLILDTDASLRRLCAFMGVDYAPEMLQYSRMVGEKVSPERKRLLWPLLDKPPTATPVYRWKREMSPTERVVFERAAQPVLAALGYETYGHVPQSVRAHLLELWSFLRQGGRFGRLLRPGRLAAAAERRDGNA
jgi:Sulfotransferase family